MEATQLGREIQNDRRDYGSNAVSSIVTEDPGPRIHSKVPKIRSIAIEQLDNGYLVNVGCQTLAIESKERLIEKFIAYINDPLGIEDKHMKGELFK